MNKQIRSEIDDKFCKFEIKKLLEGDETVSIISDTWSTDVLASDSETIEANDRPAFMPPLDRLDTASESAWSTDVLASDSERMTEVDTDDTASVAPSDARSEIEDTPPIQIHRPIPLSNAPPAPEPESPLDISSNYNMYLNNSAQFNPPSNAFRPIQDLFDPSSPTQSDANSSTPLSSNVTGKGGRKSDYQRRTMEYVDNNANIHIQSERNQENFESPTIRTSTSIPNTSRREAILLDSNSTTNGLELLLENNPQKNPEIKSKDDICERLSNVSLNSTSSSLTSSSSASESNKKTRMNGHSRQSQTQWFQNDVVTVTHTLETHTEASTSGVESTSVKVNMVTSSAIKPLSSTGAIPKSISFDMTAEKGDKDLDDDQKNKRSFFGKLKMGFKTRRGKAMRGAEELFGRYESNEDGSRFKRYTTLVDDGASTIRPGIEGKSKFYESTR